MSEPIWRGRSHLPRVSKNCCCTIWAKTMMPKPGALFWSNSSGCWRAMQRATARSSALIQFLVRPFAAGYRRERGAPGEPATTTLYGAPSPTPGPQTATAARWVRRLKAAVVAAKGGRARVSDDSGSGDFPIGWQVSFTSERPSILLNKNLKFSAGQRSFRMPGSRETHTKRSS